MLSGGRQPRAGGEEDLRDVAAGPFADFRGGAGEQALYPERLPLRQPGAGGELSLSGHVPAAGGCGGGAGPGDVRAPGGQGLHRHTV